jgi:serine/threonine protein kinase
MVIEYVRGGTIARLVAVASPLVVWAAIVAQVCAVLAAAHACGLAHRDLRPTLCSSMPVTASSPVRHAATRRFAW